jgi:hypothetical protein
MSALLHKYMHIICADFLLRDLTAACPGCYWLLIVIDTQLAKHKAIQPMQRSLPPAGNSHIRTEALLIRMQFLLIPSLSTTCEHHLLKSARCRTCQHLRHPHLCQSHLKSTSHSPRSRVQSHKTPAARPTPLIGSYKPTPHARNSCDTATVLPTCLQQTTPTKMTKITPL